MSARPGILVAALALASAVGTAGCGGAAPLLHPAHAVPRGVVTMGAGSSENLVIGRAREAIDRARVVNAQGATATPADRQAFLDGATAQVLTTPGLAPWVGGRYGFGHGDLGLTYTGRSTRLDARGVAEDEHVAFSAGVGASALLASVGQKSSSNGAIAGLDSSDVSGWGLDVPLLVGWRSDARLVQIWAGVRGGYEHASGSLVIRVDPDPTLVQTAELAGHRLYGGGLLGFAIGVAPVWAAFEVDGAWQSVDATIAGAASPTRLTGLTVAPAGALLAEF